MAYPRIPLCLFAPLLLFSACLKVNKGDELGLNVLRELAMLPISDNAVLFCSTFIKSHGTNGAGNKIRGALYGNVLLIAKDTVPKYKPRKLPARLVVDYLAIMTAVLARVRIDALDMSNFGDVATTFGVLMLCALKDDVENETRVREGQARKTLLNNGFAVCNLGDVSTLSAAAWRHWKHAKTMARDTRSAGGCKWWAPADASFLAEAGLDEAQELIATRSRVPGLKEKLKRGTVGFIFTTNHAEADTAAGTAVGTSASLPKQQLHHDMDKSDPRIYVSVLVGLGSLLPNGIKTRRTKRTEIMPNTHLMPKVALCGGVHQTHGRARKARRLSPEAVKGQAEAQLNGLIKNANVRYVDIACGQCLLGMVIHRGSAQEDIQPGEVCAFLHIELTDNAIEETNVSAGTNYDPKDDDGVVPALEADYFALDQSIAPRQAQFLHNPALNLMMD